MRIQTKIICEHIALMLSMIPIMPKDEGEEAWPTVAKTVNHNTRIIISASAARAKGVGKFLNFFNFKTAVIERGRGEQVSNDECKRAGSGANLGQNPPFYSTIISIPLCVILTIHNFLTG